MHNIILLASNGQGVGKTELAKRLVQDKVCSQKDSFALYIKKLSLDLHQNVSFLKLTKDEFNQTRKDEKILNGFSPRDLTCDVSDLVQKFYGETIWADILHHDLKNQVEKTDQQLNIVIDDWRRHIESDYIIKQQDFNIITVYLDLEGRVTKPLSKSAAKYESQIKAEDCMISFIFDKSYSNVNELIELIKLNLK